MGQQLSYLRDHEILDKDQVAYEDWAMQYDKAIDLWIPFSQLVNHSIHSHP